MDEFSAWPLGYDSFSYWIGQWWIGEVGFCGADKNRKLACREGSMVRNWCSWWRWDVGFPRRSVAQWWILAAMESEFDWFGCAWDFLWFAVCAVLRGDMNLMVTLAGWSGSCERWWAIAIQCVIKEWLTMSSKISTFVDLWRIHRCKSADTWHKNNAKQGWGLTRQKRQVEDLVLKVGKTYYARWQEFVDGQMVSAAATMMQWMCCSGYGLLHAISYLGIVLPILSTPCHPQAW